MIAATTIASDGDKTATHTYIQKLRATVGESQSKYNTSDSRRHLAPFVINYLHKFIGFTVFELLALFQHFFQ